MNIERKQIVEIELNVREKQNKFLNFFLYFAL